MAQKNASATPKTHLRSQRSLPVDAPCHSVRGTGCFVQIGLRSHEILRLTNRCKWRHQFAPTVVERCKTSTQLHRLKTFGAKRWRHLHRFFRVWYLTTLSSVFHEKTTALLVVARSIHCRRRSHIKNIRRQKHPQTKKRWLRGGSRERSGM
jgi:hypothetical protein